MLVSTTTARVRERPSHSFPVVGKWFGLSDRLVRVLQCLLWRAVHLVACVLGRAPEQAIPHRRRFRTCTSGHRHRRAVVLLVCMHIGACVRVLELSRPKQLSASVAVQWTPVTQQPHRRERTGATSKQAPVVDVSVGHHAMSQQHAPPSACSGTSSGTRKQRHSTPFLRSTGTQGPTRCYTHTRPACTGNHRGR